MKFLLGILILICILYTFYATVQKEKYARTTDPSIYPLCMVHAPVKEAFSQQSQPSLHHPTDRSWPPAPLTHTRAS